jgi:hypothetical protein
VLPRHQPLDGPLADPVDRPAFVAVAVAVAVAAVDDRGRAVAQTTDL